MIRSGEFVSDYLTPSVYNSGEDMKVNPNGVDVRLDNVARIDDGKLIMIGGEKFEVDTPSMEDSYIPPEDKVFSFEPGYYVVRYAETFEIPMGHIGLVYPRSTLMRNGLMLFSAVWDAGYEGKGVGGLAVFNEAEIQKGTRIGQMVMFEAKDSSGEYDGQYQGEGMDEDV